MRKNKDKEWLSGPGLVVLVIMSPIVVILAVQALTALYTVYPVQFKQFYCLNIFYFKYMSIPFVLK